MDGVETSGQRITNSLVNHTTSKHFDFYILKLNNCQFELNTIHFAHCFRSVAATRRGIYQFWKGKRLVGSLIVVAGAGLTFLVMIPSLLFLMLYLSIGFREHLVFDQKLKSPDGTSWFALYHDYGGLGDPDWHVFKIPINESPEELKISRSYDSYNSEDDFWKKRMLLWNFSEAGHHTSNPHIKIFNQRYLVFIRGGYYHGLYDIQEGRTLITDTSPWHSLNFSNKRNLEGLNSDQLDTMMDMWVESTLHNPIKEIIENNQKINQTSEKAL